jgi:hypothetical protein
MDKHRIFTMPFAKVYPLYVQKAEAKGRTRAEVDQVICWLTGYTPRTLADQIRREKSFEAFFAEAPAPNPDAEKVSGVICGVRIEDIDDPLMQAIRRLDKLVDELAKGRPMEKILRVADPAAAKVPSPRSRTPRSSASGPAKRPRTRPAGG